MKRLRADTRVRRHLKRFVRHLSAGLVFASLIAGSVPSFGETALRASWREERDRLAQALRNPSLGRDERRALRMALQESLDRNPAVAVAGTAEVAATAAVPSVDGVWAWIPAPTPRAFHTAIHDPVLGRMIVFGGYDWWQHALYDDAWALSLDGNPTWTPLPTAPFGGRWGHAAIYDPVRTRMVVLGGDVWSLSLGDSPAWTEITPEGTAPTPRAGLTAIYDPVRDRVVLFGGYDSAGYSNEVWALSLGDTPIWSEIGTGGMKPSARRWHSAIYDSAGDRMIVFGGDGSQGEVGDVWALSLDDTPTWTELAPSGVLPGPRSRHTAIYDPVRHRMTVFGGYSYDLHALSLDGAPTWATLTSTTQGLDWSATIYDPARDAMVGFGGEGIDWSIPVDDVWLFSLAAPESWATLQPVGRPPDRLWVPPLVFDPVRDRVLVGGERADTHVPGWWTLSLDGAALWRELLAQGTAPNAANQKVIYDALRDRLVVLGSVGPSLAVWSLSLGPSPTWALIPVAGTPPSARKGHTMVYDVLRDRVVVFGGANLSPFRRLNDVWTLSFGDTPSWSEIAPSGALPTPREHHSAIYDPVRDRMVVCGGEGANDPQDVWALSLGDTPTWSPLTPQGVTPGSTSSHTAIYDPVRDRMVVFGGQGDHASDLWALSLGGSPEWAQLTPAGPLPQPRCYQGAVYDAVHDRMLVMGGSAYCGTPETLRDVWTLTWGTPLLPPADVITEAGPASITLRWTASSSNNIVGYRIGYGPRHAAVRYSGDQAAEGPSGIEVPASQTSITLTCMPDSVFDVVVEAVGTGGGRSPWPPQMLAQPQRVGGVLAVHPLTLNPGSNGRWVSAVMEPGDGYSAGQVVLESLRLNETLAPEQATLGDENENGVPDLVLKFAREDVVALLSPGEDAELRVAGHLVGCEDMLTCSVRYTIRLIQPGVTHPVAGVQVAAGATVEIAWTLPAELAVDSVVVLASVDNQQTWEVAGSGPAGWSACEWAAPSAPVESCYVAVVAFAGGDVLGVSYGGPFRVGTALAAVGVTQRFGLYGVRPQPFRAGGRIAFGVPLAGAVTLQVFDLRGRLVDTLVDGPVSAGQHEVSWGARGVASGVFFVQLRSGALREGRRLVVVR